MPYPPERPFDADLIAAFHTTGTWIDGAFALEQGFIFTAMILSTETIAATLATYA
jgi:AGZA family xanthine/uracil permease-like MFS transporter